MVMPSNNSGIACGYIWGQYPDRMGWLLSPGDWKRPPWFVKYALDNGAFPCRTNGTEWDEDAYWKHLELTVEFPRPIFVAVPDVVTNRDATIENWHKFAPTIRAKYKYPLAFVVQDGMTVKKCSAS